MTLWHRNFRFRVEQLVEGIVRWRKPWRDPAARRTHELLGRVLTGEIPIAPMSERERARFKERWERPVRIDDYQPFLRPGETPGTVFPEVRTGKIIADKIEVNRGDTPRPHRLDHFDVAIIAREGHELVECDCTVADHCPQGQVGMMPRCRIWKRMGEGDGKRVG